MSKAKAKMTSKIISDYQSKIAEYIKKNEEISNEIYSGTKIGELMKKK